MITHINRILNYVLIALLFVLAWQWLVKLLTHLLTTSIPDYCRWLVEQVK